MFIEVRCAAPPMVSHGNYDGDSDEYGSVQVLTCQRGYKVPDTSSPEIRCQADGTWTQSSTMCEG